MPFKDMSEVLFSSYEENMISDEKLLLLCDEYSSKNPEFDMRSGCHAAKILPVGVRGTKNVWCLSSLWRASTKILNWFH